MQIYQQQLLGTREPLSDIDLTPTGGWVGVSLHKAKAQPYYNGFALPISFPCIRPSIRALSDEHFILVDRRAPLSKAHAWIIDLDGKVLAKFCTGNYIVDIVPLNECVAITYLDQAFGDNGGFDGVVLFDLAGNPLFHYEAVDCYCACAMSKTQVLALIYPDFPLVHIDSTTKREAVWAPPISVAGAHALSIYQQSVFFQGTYNDPHCIQRWDFGGGRDKCYRQL